MLKNFTEEFFLIYRNEPSVIVGKHQNTMAEINLEFIVRKAVPVIRRLSGGGTVYHDYGNINYTFITNGSEGNLVDFKKHTQPIIDVLLSLGVNARIGGKNDIRVGDKKISGNAEHLYKNRVLHHGTLLFNSNLDELNEAIRVDPNAYIDKAVKSIRSHVANISEYLKEDLAIEAFIASIVNHIKKQFANALDYYLSNNDIDAVNQLIAAKYSTWEWNYGYSPAYTLSKEVAIGDKVLRIKVNVDKGIVSQVEFDGDDLISDRIRELEAHLIGCLHSNNAISERLSTIDLSRYLPHIAHEKLLENLF